MKFDLMGGLPMTITKAKKKKIILYCKHTTRLIIIKVREDERF